MKENYLSKISKQMFWELFPITDNIPDSIKILNPKHQNKILINGELREWRGNVHQVYSPILVVNKENGQLEKRQIGTYPIASIQETTEALHAAIKAYNNGRGDWPSMPIMDTILHLKYFLTEMKKQKMEIVTLIVWEIGKTVIDAEKEFDRTIDYINEPIRSAKILSNNSNTFEVTQNFIGQTKRLPHGVVLCMGPFNYPLNETFTTLIPALIMGNTILFKPPKHGTLLFYPLLQAFRDNFPKGVVNTIYGRGNKIIPGLMESGKINVLTLIGSSKVANELKKMHPKVNRLRAILGLDAKNAAIVTPDADLNLAVKEIITGSLSFNGQRCTALKIVWVHRSVAD